MQLPSKSNLEEGGVKLTGNVSFKHFSPHKNALQVGNEAGVDIMKSHTQPESASLKAAIHYKIRS